MLCLGEGKGRLGELGGSEDELYGPPRRGLPR